VRVRVRVRVIAVCGTRLPWMMPRATTHTHTHTHTLTHTHTHTHSHTHSPHEQIDTWNRDEMNISGGSKFVPGPLPKHSLSPRGRDALYSGILECPLTDKVLKTIEGGDGFNSTFTADIFECSGSSNGCSHVVGTAAECFSSAMSLDGIRAGVDFHTSEVASDTLPSGCSVT
jgi:hypothetical protein